MILKRNLRRVCEHALHGGRVLAVGAANGVLNAATHVIDFAPPSDDLRAVDPENARRFGPASWAAADLCAGPWPYATKSFDYAFCSHALEDVRDPVAVLRELCRVARAGYIETPSRAREIFVKSRHPKLAAWLGRKPEVGFGRHRWYVENTHGQFRFLAKTAETIASPEYVLTRGEIGRDLTDEESGLGIFWSDRVDGRELVFPNSRELSFELRGFKQRILYYLKATDGTSALLGTFHHA
jgi:SAM-dependent methyltransferase